MQIEDQPAMATGLEQIAAKARREPKLRFTSLAHHITQDRVWRNLQQIPKRTAPGVDGQGVTEAKKSFGVWIEPFTARDTARRRYGACISQSPANRRNGPWAFPVSVTGRSSEVQPKSCPPSTSRISCRVHLEGVRGWVRIVPWRRSTK